MLRGDGLTRLQFVGGAGTRVLVAQPGAEVFEELSTPITGEQLTTVVDLYRPQAADAGIGGIVEERHSADPAGVLGHRPIEAHEVLAVAPYLLYGVEDQVCVRVDTAQNRVVLVRYGLAPLLQLHYDIRRFPRHRMHSGEHNVGAFAVQWECVLQHDLHVPQARVVEGGGQNGDAALPGTHLRGGGLVAVHVNELGGGMREQRTVECHDGDRFRGRAEQQGLPQAARSDSCGWGHVLRDSTGVERKPVGPR